MDAENDRWLRRAGAGLCALALAALAALAGAAACETGRAAAPPTGALEAEPLPSWRGESKTKILDFVARVTAEGSADFVPEEERIATFDNDGTLWVEKPLPVQAELVIDRVKALAPDHPDWRTDAPFAAIVAGDRDSLTTLGEHDLARILVATSTGMTTEAFDTDVRRWFRTAKNVRWDRPFTDLVYRPMLEVLSFLRSRAFATYIVSGGGADVIRPWANDAYGIRPEQVVGSRPKLAYEIRDGKPVLVRKPEADLVDDGPGKPVGIQQLIGRRPIIAFGNSDGDFEMLEWTTSAPGARLGVLIHHTDEIREWAYDRESHFGKLSRALDEAPTRGWVVVDMKNEWRVMFPFDTR